MMVAGVIVNAYHVDFADSVIRLTPSNTNYWRLITKGSGNSVLTQGYANWQHRFSEKTHIEFRSAHPIFSLGNAMAVEPRGE